MSRWKAATIHLVTSAVVIALVASILVALWYGWPLFTRMGGMKLLTILALVDLVVGPLLTVIVFKSGKPSLRFDLAVIALMQIGFLAYGVWVMTQSRPVFVVAVVDRFEVVFANEIEPEDLAKASEPQYSRLGFGAPRLVGGRLGETGKERLDLALSGFAGKDIPRLPERYADFASVQAALLSTARPASELAATSAEAAQALDRAAADAGSSMEGLVYVPIVSSRGRATMLLQREDGAIVGPVALDPWPDLVASP